MQLLLKPTLSQAGLWIELFLLNSVRAVCYVYRTVLAQQASLTYTPISRRGTLPSNLNCFHSDSTMYNTFRCDLFSQ